MTKTYRQDRLDPNLTVVIAIGETVSTAADLLGVTPIGIITPAALTGTALTIKLSKDNVTFYDFYNTSGSQVSITASTSQWIGLVAGDFAGARYMKLVSGSAEGAERSIQLVVRGT